MDQYTVPQLKLLANFNNLRGYSKLTKNQLVKLLKSNNVSLKNLPPTLCPPGMVRNPKNRQMYC